MAPQAALGFAGQPQASWGEPQASWGEPQASRGEPWRPGFPCGAVCLWVIRGNWLRRDRDAIAS